MAMIAAVCALALQAQVSFALPKISQDDHYSSFAESALSDSELATIYGTGISQVGLDQAQPASAARSIEIAIEAQRTSQQTRELTDNWNFQVASLLIADAVAQARP